MNRHSHQCTCFDLRHGPCCKSILGILSNIDVATQLRSATLVDNVCINFGIPDDGCILLARTDTCAVSRDGGINWMKVSAHPTWTPIRDFIPWKPTLGGEPASP